MYLRPSQKYMKIGRLTYYQKIINSYLSNQIMMEDCPPYFDSCSTKQKLLKLIHNKLVE